MSTKIVLKQGRGVPNNSDLDQGEIAIDHETLTLYGESSGTKTVGRIGLRDYLALDGSNTMTADIVMDGNRVTEVASPVEEDDVATKKYVDDTQEWLRVASSGYHLRVDKQHIISIAGDNPSVDLPNLGTNDSGKFVVLADGLGSWGSPNKSLSVNLNGTLQHEVVGSLVLDIPNIIVTLIWYGDTWLVYSTMMSSPDTTRGALWVENAQGIEYNGRIDTDEVHTHKLEAEYLLGTPRRHYEAIFGRAVPLDEELDSLEKRSVRHGADIQRIERFIQEARAEETNNPVVHEAAFDDTVYARQNGEWVPITQEDGNEKSQNFQHKYVNTAESQKTTHDGAAAMQYEFYSNKQNTGLNVPEGLELNSIDLDFAYFHGKHPNTAVLYNPKVSVIFKDDSNTIIKTDILVHKQEFGWGQGFEKEFQQREVLVPQGATKVLVKIDNVHDDAPQDTSAVWDGVTYYNRIGIEGYWY